MIFNLKFYFALFLSLFLIIQGIQSQTPAFPGAGGGGMFTTGGRGGKVLYVTSLSDDGSVGTLRWAINQTGARTILFKVSGIITLNSALRISNGNVTIAGQTAPGAGICLRNYELNINADNVIVRFMRFRLGNLIITNESDAIWGRYRKNIILDHCSASWSIDECASFYSNENFTMQWCIIAESLNNAGHSKGAHGYGGLWGGKNASFHHNLIAHHNSRNPRFNGWKRSGLSYTNPLDEERVDFRNNVIYNWGDNSSYGGEAAGKYNIVANYFKYGPATKSGVRYKITQADIDVSTTYQPRHGTYFIKDNYVFGSSANTQNNWLGVTYASGVTEAIAKATVPFQATGIVEHTAEVAFERVMGFAGASLKRDTIDRRIIREARNGTATHNGSVSGRPGIIDTQNDVGGWPAYNSATAPADSDGDGIPDGWLAANYPGKTANELNHEGYTYLEVYLNSLVENITNGQHAGALVSRIFNPVRNNDADIRVIYHQFDKKLTLKSEFEINRVIIRDLSGRTMKNQTFNGQEVSVDVSGLTSSVYLISVYGNGISPKTIKVAL